MALYRAVLRLLIALALVSLAHGIKCQMGTCTETGQPCAPAVETDCSSQSIPPLGAPDRCMILRAVTVTNIPVLVRNCSFSAVQCATPELICKSVNSTGGIKSCNVHCCNSDNCNSGPMPTEDPKKPTKPTGPSGSDLSCYTCDNAPEDGKPVVSCEKPPKQTCGIQEGLGLPQDRCLSLKAKAIVNGTEKEVEMRNCTSSTICKMDLCKLAMSGYMQKQNVTVTECKASCCVGNLCNDGSFPTSMPPSAAPTTAPGPDSAANRFESGLVAVVTMLMLAYLGHA